MEVFWVYLLLKLDSFNTLMIFLSLALGAGAGIKFLEHISFDDGVPKIFKYATIAFPFCLLLTIAMPSTKQMAILLGAHYVVAAAQSPEGQKAQQLIRKKINEILDEELNKSAANTAAK